MSIDPKEKHQRFKGYALHMVEPGGCGVLSAPKTTRNTPKLMRLTVFSEEMLRNQQIE